MKKITTVAISLTSLMVMSFADADIPRPSFSGFYAGFGAGFIRSDASLDTNFSVNQELQAIFNAFPLGLPLILPLNVQTGQSLDEYANSAIGDLHIGYGHQFQNRLYVGIEAFVNGAQRNFDTITQDAVHTGNISQDVNFNTSVHSTTDVSMNPLEYGTDLHFGILTDSMTTQIYGKIGAAINRLDISTTNIATANFTVPQVGFNSGNIISTATADESKNIVGLRLGLGIEQLISCHWSIRADYTYTDYGTVDTQAMGNLNGTSATFNPGDPDNQITINIVPITNGIVQNASAHLRSNAFTLGLSYYF